MIPSSSPTAQYDLSYFVFFNGTTNTVRPLVNGETLIVGSLDNIRAVSQGSGLTVNFYVNNTYVKQDNTPYALCGGTGVNAYVCGEGTFLIRANLTRGGIVYNSIEITITIKKSRRRLGQMIRRRQDMVNEPDGAPVSRSRRLGSQSSSPRVAPPAMRVLEAASTGRPSTVSELKASKIPSSEMPVVQEPPVQVLEPSKTMSASPQGPGSSSRGRDGDYFCRATDYPCGEGRELEPQHVVICQRTVGTKYRQLCIPEERSELLRFHPSDYCGPCQGSFQIVFDHLYENKNPSDEEL